MNLVNFNTYQDVIRHYIDQNHGVRGYQTLMAQAAGCQRSYLSQVLHGSIHITPDHAAGLCIFWSLPQLDTDYFLNLVALARAGSPHLKKILQDKQRDIKRQASDLSQRLKSVQALNEEMCAAYYSSWHWAAIHMLTSIKRYQTPQLIAERLSLPIALVNETLAGLERMGMIKRQRPGGWKPTQNDMHLPIESIHNVVNHFSWRQRATAHMQLSRGFTDIHYTGAHTMSLRDAEKIKELLRQALTDSREIIKPSPEEECFAMMVDFFPV